MEFNPDEPFRSAISQLFDLKSRVDIVLFGHMQTTSAWQITERSLPEHLVYLVVEEALRGFVAGQPVHAGASTLLWLTPGVPHRFFNADSERPIRLYHLRFRVTQACPPDWRLVQDAAALRNGFVDLFEEHHAALRSEERVRALLAAVLIDSLRDRFPSSTHRGLNLAQQRCLQRFAMAREFRVAPSEFAKELRLSADHFRRVFRQTFGCSAQRWILERRVKHAAALLLESDITVSALSDRLGYSDVFLFSRQFKQVLGLSPLAYRRRYS